MPLKKILDPGTEQHLPRAIMELKSLKTVDSPSKGLVHRKKIINLGDGSYIEVRAHNINGTLHEYVRIVGGFIWGFGVSYDPEKAKIFDENGVEVGYRVTLTTFKEQPAKHINILYKDLPSTWRFNQKPCVVMVSKDEESVVILHSYDTSGQPDSTNSAVLIRDGTVKTLNFRNYVENGIVTSMTTGIPIPTISDLPPEAVRPTGYTTGPSAWNYNLSRFVFSGEQLSTLITTGTENIVESFVPVFDVEDETGGHKRIIVPPPPAQQPLQNFDGTITGRFFSTDVISNISYSADAKIATFIQLTEERTTIAYTDVILGREVMEKFYFLTSVNLDTGVVFQQKKLDRSYLRDTTYTDAASNPIPHEDRVEESGYDYSTARTVATKNGSSWFILTYIEVNEDEEADLESVVEIYRGNALLYSRTFPDSVVSPEFGIAVTLGTWQSGLSMSEDENNIAMTFRALAGQNGRKLRIAIRGTAVIERMVDNNPYFESAVAHPTNGEFYFFNGYGALGSLFTYPITLTVITADNRTIEVNANIDLAGLGPANFVLSMHRLYPVNGKYLTFLARSIIQPVSLRFVIKPTFNAGGDIIGYNSAAAQVHRYAGSIFQLIPPGQTSYITNKIPSIFGASTEAFETPYSTPFEVFPQRSEV